MLKIAIDAGHGSDNEPGAVFNGIAEKDVNLDVAFLLETELKRCGIQTVMTRTNDIFLSLSERAKIAKTTGCNSLISIHFNANDEASRGTEMIYSFLEKCQASSKWIAECVLNETVKLGTIKRGFWTKESGTYPGHNYYGVLRNLEPLPGIIAEGLFLDNLEDVKILKSEGFLRKIAVAYAKGICTAYGIVYVADPAFSPVEVKVVETPKEPNPFSDWDKVGNYAKDAVKLMKDLGFMVGDATGNFNPTGTLTRQDFALVMSKIIKKYNLG